MREKNICNEQGVGKMNPVFIGGYDNERPTNNIDDVDYWIGSGDSFLFDQAANGGQGEILHFEDRLKISKGAAGACNPTVTLELKAKPMLFEYFPPHSLDAVFVLDVTASMMTGGSLKMTNAKRALINTINKLWDNNKDTIVTIIPYGRDAMIPQDGGGLKYDYLGTLFSWRRSVSTGNRIGQLLGYRNNSVIAATIPFDEHIQLLSTQDANTQQSLYNSYNYYKIKYSDVYNDDGTAKPDVFLSNYINDVYTPNSTLYNGNVIQTVASGAPLSEIEKSFSMNDGDYTNNTILDNAIWAIPYSEDTNTEAGLTCAYNLLKTPGFAHSDNILRRAVILVTDGQANRSINENYKDTYVTLSSVESDFDPDVAGGPYKYFMYLTQTLPHLLNDLNARSASNEELIRAMDKVYDIGQKIKDEADGNSLIFILGIELDAQVPSPFTKEDVINILKTVATSPLFLRETSGEIIEDELSKIISDILHINAGLDVDVVDTINTALFDFVPGSLKIEGLRDGIKLKIKSAPDITDPTDVNFTIYKKQPLLPDVSDENLSNGVITISLGIIPHQLASADSESSIKISYELVARGSAGGDHLHTNHDEETYAKFREPSHQVSEDATISYITPARLLNFHTPIVSCNRDLTVNKFVGLNKDEIIHKQLTTSRCGKLYYKIVVTNHTEHDILVNSLIDEQFRDLLQNGTIKLIQEDFNVPANSSIEFFYDDDIKCSEIINNMVTVTYGEVSIYDETSVITKKTYKKYRIEYLDCCTKRPIRRCNEISVDERFPFDICKKIICINCYKFNYFVKKEIKDIDEATTVIKLYYCSC